LQDAEVLLNAVALSRQLRIRKTVGAKPGGRAAVEAPAARIQVVPNAKIEREGAESGAEPAVDVDLGRRAVRERDALARDADIVLQVLADVVARFEIGGDRRPVVGLGDAAEDIV